MKKALFTTLVLLSSTLATAASIEGRWLTMDDETKKPKAIVEIKQSGGTFTGTIVGLAAGVSNDCTVCKDKKPLIGRQVVFGLKQDSENEYSGGRINDPKSGKSYKSTAVVKGNKLAVRGHVGPFYRTQTWTRQ